MKATTWIPGSNLELDAMFDSLREKQYQDKSHRLYKNYSKEYWANAGIVANTIAFNSNNEPEVCATISNRTCWPSTVYRIYNRTWKCSNKQTFLRTVTPAMALVGKSQIQWLYEHTDCDLYFISRQTDNWQAWMIKSFFKNYAMPFRQDEYAYLTCPNSNDDSCWQRIIYNGSENILTQWQRKPVI